MADLSATIEAAAANPAKVVTDGLEVDSRPIPEIIAADVYLIGKAAVVAGQSPWSMIHPTQMIPPGSV